jgi:hypothetical protein
VRENAVVHHSKIAPRRPVRVMSVDSAISAAASQRTAASGQKRL